MSELPIHLDGGPWPGGNISAVGDGFFGTISNLHETAYHGVDRLSAHGARLLNERCPSVYRYRQDHPKPPTKALIDGRLFHALLLEPTKAIATYTPLYEGFDGRTKEGRSAMQAIEETGKEAVNYETWGRVNAMVSAIRAHPLAGPAFAAGRPELSLFWHDDLWATRTPQKARPDWLPDNSRLIIDPKTVDGASLLDLEKDMVNYGYHYQAAQYEEGALKLGLRDDPKFVMVIVEKEPPYEVVVARPSDEAIALGRKKLGEARAMYARCRDTGVWPGYADPNSVVELGLPRWAAKQLEA